MATSTVRTPQPGAANQPRESLDFRPSRANSVGVEIELQVLDRDSGELAPGSARILPVCAEEGLDGVTAELMQSMIEVKTGICSNVAEVRDDLLPVLRRVHHVADSLGYHLAPGGTHPFSRPMQGAVFPAERYQRMQDRLGFLTYHIVVYGLHVHIGMPDGDTSIGVQNALVQYLPHLLALSANSPFWQGVDTGMVSCRAVLFQLAPHAGVPLYFPSWKDFCAYAHMMMNCGIIRATKDIHWDIRPRPQTGTIEFRICDMPPTLSSVLGLTALIRCLAIAAQRLLERKPRLRRGDLRHHWMAVENKFLAARYGLQAKCIRIPGGKREPLVEGLTTLLEQFQQVARESGDEAFLNALLPLDRFETGAERQRRLYREGGNWRTVIDDMRQRWGQEIESEVQSSRFKVKSYS